MKKLSQHIQVQHPEFPRDERRKLCFVAPMQSTGKGAKKCVPISLSQSILSFSNVEEVMEYYASMEEEQEVRHEVSIGESMEEFEGAESNEESEMEDREQKRLEVKGNAGEMDMEHHDHSGGTEGGHQTHSFLVSFRAYLMSRHGRSRSKGEALQISREIGRYVSLEAERAAECSVSRHVSQSSGRKWGAALYAEC